MRRAFRMVFLSLLALVLTGCGSPIWPSSEDAPSKSTASAGKTALDKASEATSAVAVILNPAEELVGFSPTGILRWSSATGADAYEVWAYNDAGLTNLAEFSKALASRQYQFTQLTGGKTYWVKLYFRVKGVWQELPTFTLQTTVNVTKSRLINSQEELEAFGPNGTLRWTAVPGADVYEVWIYRDAQLVAFAETSGPVRITQYQITSLEVGLTYHVQIYARVNGQFTNGGALRLTVTDRLDRARILNPQEELDAFATNGLLRWSPVTGATAYELWIFTNPNSSEIHESSGSLTARSYQTRTLQPGKVYYAQAYALVNGQWQVGAPVRIASIATPDRSRLTTPQEQIETFSTTGTLRWTEVPGATAYELWIYSNAGLGKIVESGARGANADRSYTVRGLCNGGVYYVQVYALVNGVWTTGWATQLNVTQGASAADCTPPAPTVNLKGGPTRIERGENATLNWTSQFATSCTARDGWSGTKATSGQQSVGPLDKDTLFTLVCTGPSGATLAQTLVPVNPLFYRYRGLINLDSTLVSTPLTSESALSDFGDLNGDGHLDLLVVGTNAPWNGSAVPANPARPGRVFLGDGQGGFARASASLFPVDDLLTVAPRKILWADFNGDGRSDVFIADHGWDGPPFPGRQNLLFLSTPAGGWRSATATLPQVSDFSHTAAAADIDRDGDIDIFVGNGYNNNGAPLTAPYLLINDGQGRFARNDADVPVAPGQALYMFNAVEGGVVHFAGAAFSDLDGDGWPDLVVTADAGGSMEVFRNSTIFWNQSGRFDSTHITRLTQPSGLPQHLDLDADFADFDGDGLLDIVLIGTNSNPSYDAGFVQVFRGLGHRQFADVTAQVLPAGGQLGALDGIRTDRPYAQWVRVLDFNGDLAPDFRVEVCCSRWRQDTPIVWINDGTGRFSVIKTDFFVEAGQEWSFGNGLLVPSSKGWQNYTTQLYADSGGLLLTGRVTSKPYFGRPDDAGDEMLVGTAGANWFVGGRGNDVIDGKAGVDYATYSGKASGYRIDPGSTGFTVTDIDPTDGDEGADRVLSIELLRFADKVIDLRGG